MENFEAKLERIKKLLDRLNNPEISLKEAVNCYREGMELIAQAQKMIEEAELEIREIGEGNFQIEGTFQKEKNQSPLTITPINQAGELPEIGNGNREGIGRLLDSKQGDILSEPIKREKGSDGLKRVSNSNRKLNSKNGTIFPHEEIKNEKGNNLLKNNRPHSATEVTNSNRQKGQNSPSQNISTSPISPISPKERFGIEIDDSDLPF